MGLLFFVFSVLASADTYMLAVHNPQMDSQDFTVLQSLVQTQNFENPESFLQDWKKAKPEYFSNYVLGYRSRSLQQSSFLHPRAILFNKNADLIISFNGHEKHKGFNNLELVHFNHDTKTFEFHEMSFERGKAKLSEANPKKCLACHQSVVRADVNPRPNWEPYNTWPGFYGSLDDKNTLFLNSAKRELDPVADALMLYEVEAEITKIHEFRSTIQPTHPRYSLLSASTKDQYNEPDATLNGDLTNRLAVLNFKRIAKLIRTLPPEIYNYTKWAVWAHVQCGMTFYVEEDVFNWLYSQVPNKDLSRRQARTPIAPSHTPSVFMDGDQQYVFEPYTPPAYKNTDTSDVINVLFEPAGISTEDWSMDFKTDGGRFAAFERFGVTNDPRPPWREAIKRELSEDPELKDLDCQQAQVKSLERYSNLETVKAAYTRFREAQPKAPSQSLLQRCMNCHTAERTGRSTTPYIPFGEPDKLKTALQKAGYRHGTLLEEIRFRVGPHATEEEQMPKGATPTAGQINELLRYLESLQ